MLLVVLPFAIIRTAIGPDMLSTPLFLVVPPFAIIHVPITARRLSASMLHAIHPLSLIDTTAICRFERSFAVLFAILPFTLIYSSIRAFQNTKSTLNTFFPRPNKRIPTLVYELSIAVLLVILIFALVNRAILARVSPSPMLLTEVKVSDIVIAVVVHVRDVDSMQLIPRSWSLVSVGLGPVGLTRRFILFVVDIATCSSSSFRLVLKRLNLCLEKAHPSPGFLSRTGLEAEENVCIIFPPQRELFAF
mmetsp:Transcript_7503/g.25589  ORF Transcript_7503/g.25589 Transcript_7503/m.25589 type:complete len:248 (-) Transcript_7503:442-1185(-)